MPRVRTAYRQPVPLQRDLASRVTLVHRRAQLDVPRLQNPSAHQLHTPITLIVQLHTRLCLFTT